MTEHRAVNNIKSLSELLDLLEISKASDFHSMKFNLDLSVDELKPFVSWNAERYTRNCIRKKDHYELILLCWNKKQETKIHCHGGEECWVHVLQGCIEERIYEQGHKALNQTDSRILTEGKTSFMNDDLGFHSLHNISKNQAITLHLYMNPIEECTYFNDEDKTFLPAKMKFD